MSNMTNANAYRLPDGRMAVDVDSNKTLAQADCGYVQNIIADGVILTSPATATLGRWTARNGGGVTPTSNPSGDGTTGFSVLPASGDQFLGISGTPVDDKKVINTKTTAHYGDEITWQCLGITAGPLVTGLKGTFARET